MDEWKTGQNRKVNFKPKMFCISLCVTGRELTDTEGEMAFFSAGPWLILWSQWSLITKEEELIMISNRFLQDMPFIQFKNKNSCAAALLFVLFGVCSPILCPADRHSSWVCAVCYMKEVKQLILCNNDKNCIKLCKKGKHEVSVPQITSNFVCAILSSSSLHAAFHAVHTGHQNKT